MLEVAHALGQPLHVIEEMTATEVLLHFNLMTIKAEEEKAALEKAERKSGRGGKFQPVVSFKRTSK
jgi:hypothetical protein